MTEIDLEENLSNVACLVKFVIILDNNGKLIYSKYFTEKDQNRQREFEKQLCFQVKNLNITQGELDIFSMDDYNIFVKIIGEIAYFIGLNEEDNECLGYNFCKIFENCLGNITNDNFERPKIFDNLEKIIVMIDEMLDNGLIVNTDSDSISKLICHQEETGSKFISFGTSDNSSSGGGLFSSLFSGARSIFG
jgi:hypothetical protein